MTHRATLVLSLCFALLTPFAAQAQETPPPASPEAAPAEGVLSEEAPADQAPPAPPVPAPAPAAPEAAPPVPESVQTTDEPAGTSTSVSVATPPAADDPGAAASDKAKKDRCAVLMAQGQSALAQAEGCGGKDQPIFTGSIVSLTQTGAPGMRTMPYNNRFAALSLYLAPRLTLTNKWALIADVSMAYEQTIPDDTADRHEVQFTDPRLIVNGNLGKWKGFNFTASPRLTIPVSAPSQASKAIIGVGTGLNIIRSLDVLDGLALIVGGAYNHTFARNVVRTNEDREDGCDDITGSVVSCPVGNLGIVQDTFRAIGTASLSFNSKISAQAQYLYGWNFVKKLSDLPRSIPGVWSDDTPALTGDELDRDVSRWRRIGSLTLAVNYQPADWVIASVQGNTSVCYAFADGMQSSLGGCSGGAATSDFWLRNPIVNKFSTIALSFTIPIDVVYTRIKNREGVEKSTAKKGPTNKL